MALDGGGPARQPVQPLLTGARMPPANLEAEQALLGAIFANNKAFHHVVAFLKPEHFADPVHSHIYRECARLILRGSLADAVTLKAVFEQSGTLEEVGGTSYLVQLLSAMVGIVNAGEYGRAIHDAWLRRQLIDIGETVVNRAFGGDVNLDGEAQLAAASDALLDLSTGAAKDAPEVSAGDAARMAVRRAEEAARGVGGGALSSGLGPLDAVMGKLWPEWFFVLGGRPGMGKEQPVDMPVLTPAGWRAMGDLRVGDLVIGSDGASTRVTGVFPQGTKQAYEVTFRDGGSAECGADHLGSVASDGGRCRGQFTIHPLRDLLTMGLTRDKGGRRVGAKWRIPIVKPVQFPAQKLPIDPYVLGVLIGDGSISGKNLRFSNPDIDQDIREAVAERLPADVRLRENRSGACPYFFLTGAGRSAFAASLETLGLRVKSPVKFIPALYMLGSVEQRMALLRGLMDTDGACRNGKTTFYTVSAALARDVVALVRSLGGIAWVRSYDRTDEGKRVEYAINIRIGVLPFATQRKVAQWKPAQPCRYIRSVSPSRVVEQVCISVEAADGLYVTKDYIVTHNTSLACQMILGAARQLQREEAEAPPFSGAGGDIVVFSLEMPAEQLCGWLCCQIAGVANDVLQDRAMTEQEAFAMLQAQRELDALPIKVIDQVGMSGPAIALRARAMNARRRVRMVVVDHVQKIVAARDGRETETVATQKASSALKDLARKIKAPVLALWQLSRDVDRRDDPRPRLSDLLYGGETDADVACFLFRAERYLKKRPPEKYAKETDEQHAKRVHAWHQQWDEARGRAEIIVAKRRQGPEGVRVVRFDGPTTSFSEIGAAAPPDDLWGELE